MPTVALDPRQHAAHLLRRVAVDVVENELGVAENGIERRAQLVAHVGKELRLVPACLRELPALVLKLSRALAQFVEEPSILNSDDSLAGEAGNQRDLLLGEWPYFGSVDYEGPDQLAFLAHRYRDQRPRTAVHRRWAGLVRRLIGIMDKLLSLQRRSSGAPASGRNHPRSRRDFSYATGTPTQAVPWNVPAW